MSYQYLRNRPAMFIGVNASGDMMAANMNGVSAGIVADAQIYSQPSQMGAFGAALSTPATWSYIWVGIAMLYLVAVYVGALRIAGRGE